MRPTPHGETEEAIPAYAAGRLAPEERARIEAHLIACEECRDLAAEFQDLASAFGEWGGEAVFGPHPAVEALRDYAREDPSGEGDVGRHLRWCATCELEVAAWRSRAWEAAAPDRMRTLTVPNRSRAAWLGAAASLAAGLAVGVAMSLLWHGSRATEAMSPSPESASRKTPLRPAVPEPKERAGPSESGAPQEPTTPSPGGSGAGVGVSVHLPGAVRGAGRAPKLRVPPGAALVTLTAEPIVPPSLPGDSALRLEVRRPDGRAVWSSTTLAAEIRGILDASVAVAITLPAASLPPGAYELTLARGTGPSAEVLHRLPFEIVAAP